VHSARTIPTNIGPVSTIGAGDTFIAGILFNWVTSSSMQLWDAKKSLEFATELAGRKVLQEGFQGLGEAMALGSANILNT
jgi:ketohexokinase